MIKVETKKENEKYKSVKILAKDMKDENGKDIVCSAASSIVTTTVNGILSLKKGSLSYMISKQGMNIKVLSDDNNTQILIQNMISLLKELEKNYKDNIQVK